MSTNEKETYFDGPHMSSANFQPSFTSVVDQRRFSNSEPQSVYSASYAAHSSNEVPISSYGVSLNNATTSDSLKFSHNSESTSQTNQQHHFNIAPHEQMHQPPIMVPNEGVADVATIPFVSASSNSTGAHNSQFLNDQQFVQQQPQSNQNPSMIPSLYPGTISDECTLAGQPVGTYMNIAYNSVQQQNLPFSRENATGFQPIPNQVDVNTCAVGDVENIRSEQVSYQNNVFTAHPGPSSTSGLYQEAELQNRNNAEDILHSQGTWPSHCYANTSAEYVAHQTNDNQSIEPTAALFPLENDEEDEIAQEMGEPTDQCSDHMVSLESAMNNLALSQENSPIQVEKLNIEAGGEDSYSDTNNTETEKPELVENVADDVDTPQLKQNLIYHPDLLSTAKPVEEETSVNPHLGVSEQPLDELQETSSSSLRQDEQVDQAVSLVLDADSGVPADRQEDELCLETSDTAAAYTEEEHKSLVGSKLQDPALGDATSYRRTSLEEPISNAISTPAVDKFLQPSHITPHEQPEASVPPVLVAQPRRAGGIYTSVVDTVSMHSSYVSVHPPSSDAVSGNVSSPASIATPASNLPLTLSSTLTSHYNENTALKSQANSHALRSQMRGGDADLHLPPPNQQNAPPSHPNALPTQPTAPSTQRNIPSIQPNAPPPQRNAPPPQPSAPPPQPSTPPSQRTAPPPQRTAPPPQSNAPATQQNAPLPQPSAPSSLPSAAPLSQPTAPPTQPTAPPSQSSAHLYPASWQPSYSNAQHVSSMPNDKVDLNQTAPPACGYASHNYYPSASHQSQDEALYTGNSREKLAAFNSSEVPSTYQHMHQSTSLSYNQPFGNHQSLPASHVSQATNDPSEQHRTISNSNLPAAAQTLPSEWRSDPHRNHSRPQSSLGALENPHPSRFEADWYNRGESYGRWRRDPYARYSHYDNYGSHWSREQQYYDYYHGRSYYDHDPYRRYEPGYGHYPQRPDYYPHYEYDQYGKRYQQYHSLGPSGYYGPHYRRAQEDDDEPRSVYSDISYSYQDPNHTHGYLGKSTFDDSWIHNTYEEDLPQPKVVAPFKFPKPHSVITFGAGGQLVVVTPITSADRVRSTVQIHNVEILLEKTEEAEQFNQFPGPLSKTDTHKADVVQFIVNQSKACSNDTSLIDRQSSALLWDLLEIMVRQNGNVMGTDIAELLMRGHSGDFNLLASPNESRRRVWQESEEVSRCEPTLADEISHNYNVTNDACPSVRFRDLLLYGRKKDALDWAMKSGLWGHALLLASKTDTRTHANVMIRFANSLAINDPLQTLYQLMSGREPASCTCIADGEWGDWRPHLAMILSNAPGNPCYETKALFTMGDTLFSRGLEDAAHFCYLMANMSTGYFEHKSCKVVLIGSNHTRSFKEFSTNKAIERTTIYEYAVRLGSSSKDPSKSMTHIPQLQVYKFIYACRMMEYGMVAKAFHYIESIAKLVIQFPSNYPVAFVNQLETFADRMKVHDASAQAGTQHASDLQWIRTLAVIKDKLMAGSIIPPSASYPCSVALSEDASSAHHPHHPADKYLTETDHSGEGCDTDVESLNKYDLEEEFPEVRPHEEEFPEVPLGVNAPSMVLSQDSPPAPSLHIAPPPLPNSVPDPREFNDQIPPPIASTVLPHRLQHQQDPQPVVSAPIFYNPKHFTQFQPHSSTPNTSLTPLTPPQPHQPPEEQRSPDIYEHLTNPRQPRHQPRVRTESQTSHGSRHSHLSRKSFGRRSRTTSERSTRSRSRSTSMDNEPQPKPEAKKGWFGWFFKGGKPKIPRAHLPDDSKKDIQWDPKLNRWVDANATEEELAPPKPPPMDAPDQVPSSSNITSGPATLTRNKYSLKNMSGRAMYKNAFGSAIAPSASSNFMAPSSGAGDTLSSMIMPGTGDQVGNSSEQMYSQQPVVGENLAKSPPSINQPTMQVPQTIMQPYQSGPNQNFEQPQPPIEAQNTHSFAHTGQTTMQPYQSAPNQNFEQPQPPRGTQNTHSFAPSGQTTMQPYQSAPNQNFEQPQPPREAQNTHSFAPTGQTTMQPYQSAPNQNFEQPQPPGEAQNTHSFAPTGQTTMQPYQSAPNQNFEQPQPPIEAQNTHSFAPGQTTMQPYQSAPNQNFEQPQPPIEAQNTHSFAPTGQTTMQPYQSAPNQNFEQPTPPIGRNHQTPQMPEPTEQNNHHPPNSNGPPPPQPPSMNNTLTQSSTNLPSAGPSAPTFYDPSNFPQPNLLLKPGRGGRRVYPTVGRK